MKKFLLFPIMLILWTAPEAFTQFKAPDNQLKINLSLHPGRPASAQEALYEARKPSLVPTYWMLDSSWYSNWIVNSSSWFVNEKDFLYYNNSGGLQDNLYTVFNTVTDQWNNLTRYVYSYGTQGNTVSYTGQTWYLTGGNWVNFMYYHYNGNGEIDTSFYLNFNQNANNFSSGNKSIYSYNSNNQVLQTIGQVWDSSSQAWVNSSIMLYTYQTTGQMSEQITQNWNASQGNWVNSQKIDYSYDGSGFATGYITYTWNQSNSQWIQSMQAIYTNSVAGLPTQKLYQQWNSGTNAWQNSEMDTYQYNVNNQMLQTIDKLWDAPSSVWMNNWMQTNSYYSNGIQDTVFQYYWNPNTSNWMASYYSLNDSSGYVNEYYSKSIDWTTYTYVSGYLFQYFYNSQNQTTEYQHYNLNITTGNWDLSSHHLYTYDGNGNNTMELDQNYNDTSSSYVNTYKIDHFYSFTTGIFKKTGLSSTCYYMNPLPKGKPIQCQNLQDGKNYEINIYSTKGQQLYTSLLLKGESLFLPQNLADGVYFLQVVSNGKIIAQGKIILTN